MLHLFRNRSFSALTLTQFLGAFNDNAFKQLVLLLSVSTALPWIAEAEWVGQWGQSLALAAFSVPFVLFGVLGGSVADRFSKRNVMVAANLGEVLVMALGGLALVMQRYELLLVVLFLMGLQSTFFGPSKYGSIPELTEPRDLSRANGIIQMTTNVAIVLGTALGTTLLEQFEGSLLTAAGVFTLISGVGFASSLFLQPLPARAPGRPIRANPIREVRRQWSTIRGQRALVLSLIASALFFHVGAVLMLVINQYGVWMELSRAGIAILLAIVSLGIAAGSMLAGRLSGDRIESGLIPAGLGGLAVATLAVLAGPESLGWLRTCLFAAGVSAGVFGVPIRALIQHLPAPEERGSVLGLSEVLDFVGIFLAAGVYGLLHGTLALEPPQMMAALGGLTLVFAAGSTFYTAEFALRFWLALFIRVVYRIRTDGIENVPRRGGALLVSNHLSFVDAFLVSAALDRPVRFMMYRPFFDLPLVGRFCHRMGAIPVSSQDTHEQKQASIEYAAQLLRDGELVCIFAEGHISRTGSLGGFRRGLERIARKADTPILPVALDGVWGSLFSFERGRFFWKRPRNFSQSVTVDVGEALPADAPAWLVRNRVQELIAATRRGASGDLATRFLRSARKHRRRTAIVDSSGARLTYGQLLTRSLALRSAFRRHFRDDERIGLMLPPGAPAAAAHLGVVLAGKVPIQLNYSLGAAELAHPIASAGLRHVVTSPKFLRALDEEPPLAGDGTVWLERLAEVLTTFDKLRAALFARLPAWLLVRLVRPGLSPDSTATILFSSGSTGAPKGVVLTHRNVLSNVDAMIQAMALTPADRILGVLPFFHSFGHAATLWAPLLGGAAAVYHNRPTDAQTIGELAEANGVTISLATPTFYQAWMRRIPASAFASLRLAVTGAERLQPRLGDAFEAKYGTPLLEGYGCTELSPCVAVNLPSAGSGGDAAARPGSVGRPLPGVSVRVLDPDTGDELPLDAEGSVFVTGPNVMAGYLDDPARTREVLRDGWYDTGDVGRLDRDGFLTLTDRRSRFSKIGGEMVPQGRIEEVLVELVAALSESAGVASEDAPQIAVTAVPDDRKGERLVVLHTALPFERSALVEAVRASALPALFQPRGDQYFEVEDLPKLGTGKTDLKGLKDLALDRAS